MYPVTNPIPSPLIVGIIATKGIPIIHIPKIKLMSQKAPETFKELQADKIIL